MAGKKVLIVGGVAGGTTAATRLRRLDEQAEIVVFERGDYISYANCGLPYHVSDVIPEKNSLLVQTPETMKAKYNVDVRVRQEVTAIDPERKSVAVKKRDGETYAENYDVLLLATGSSPVKPPIPGIDSPRVLTLWTVDDAVRIRDAVKRQGARRAAVVGGGFIGLEVAENLSHAGVKVSIVEMQEQVMAPFDYEMAQLLHENIEQNGAALYLNDGVSAFHDRDGEVVVTLQSGKQLACDLVVLAIGVRPNSGLAKAAGLALNSRGGVVTDDMMRTSDPSIYAVGDVVEVEHFIDKSRTMIPLAGPANKQGRIAADNIAGGAERYKGTQGTSVAQVYGLTAANTGQNEKELLRRGLVRGKDYESVVIVQNSHAGYYPGATPMTLKLLFSADGRRLYGAQAVGMEGVDKRIDVLAAAIRLGAGVDDLKTLELAYAPPYSSAKDPVNMAGFTAENVLTGKAVFCGWDALEKRDPEKTLLLDVREDVERLAYSLPGSVNIPLGELRERIEEIDRNKEIIVFCAIGVRSYNAARTLMGSGFPDVKVYPGGTRFYLSTHYRENGVPGHMPAAVSDGGHPKMAVSDSGHPKAAEAAAAPDSGHPKAAEAPPASADISLDCRGLACPGPIMKVFETMKGMQDGDTVEVRASDPGFARDIDAWSRRTGHTLLSVERPGGGVVARIRKGALPDVLAAVAEKKGGGKTIVVFSGDLDKVLASFIIANGAAAMGRPVTLFFTFWGLNVLRKKEKQGVKKSMVESMFGGMMPRGAGKLRLSKMDMGGMGTAMMKKVMRDKNIDSLEELIKKAMAAGVKIVACTMSMDVMGIRPEELIDGVELGGVGAYLGDAEEADVNLFIW